MLFLLITLPGLAMGLPGENSQCHGCDRTCEKFPVGDARNCHLTEGIVQFESLTGIGWDNILNKEMGKVLQQNYSQCVMSEDHKYLIPDHTFLIPVKKSDVNIFAEYFDHWLNYTDMTANSINVEALYNHVIHIGVSGSFSTNYNTIKSHMVKDQSKALRVQLRYHRYTMKTDSRFPLDPTFHQRLLEVAAHIQKNDDDMARYLTELIVRDYGTHYITSVDAGGIFAKEDTVKNHYIKDFAGDMKAVKTSASVILFSMMKVAFDYQHMIDEEQQSAYQRNCTFSHVVACGGPVFGGNVSVNDWVHGLENALVAIDRSGKPLHHIITADNFPTLPDPVLHDLTDMVEEAITHYYEFNTYPGCTDPNKSNFVFVANVDDGSCIASPMNFTFGGSFQNCSSNVDADDDAGDLCQNYTQKNPLTNSFSCPSSFRRVLLYNGTVSSTPVNRCYKCGWLHIRKCCKEFTSTASYQAYWCAATGPVDKMSGYMFGGFYTTMPNSPTGGTSCPATFYPVIFLGRDMYICISDDYELGYIHSVPFAGFYSCMSGNPLSVQQPTTTGAAMKNLSSETDFGSEGNPWPKQCPKDYSQHLLIVEGGCAVNYCVKSGSLSLKHELPNIRLPPFSRDPNSKLSDEAHKSEGISTGTTAGIVIGALLVVGFIICGIVWCHRRRLNAVNEEELIDLKRSTSNVSL